MKRLFRYMSRFGALGTVNQRTLLFAAVLMPVFWLGLRVWGLARFQARLHGRPIARSVPMTMLEIQALGDLVNVAARHTLGPRTCLTRSLLLGWLLRRRGISSQLRIGVRFTLGVLDAHAWVECDGVPVNDQPDVSTRFASFGDLVPLKAFQTP